MPAKVGAKMRCITLHLPEPYIKALEELVKQGIYPNRSEAIRAAVRDLLEKEFKMLELRKRRISSSPSFYRGRVPGYYVSFRVPSSYYEAIQQLVRMGRYENVSSLIRAAIRELIEKKTAY